MKLRIITWICALATIVGMLSGCSLAVDTQQDIEIPIRKDTFDAQDGQTAERLKEVVEEYQPSF